MGLYVKKIEIALLGTTDIARIIVAQDAINSHPL
jgi:hypothetical protein